MLGAVDPEPLIEVLFFEGCPHYQPLLSRLRQLLQTSNIDIEIVEREMITDEMSVEQRFRGSPTVRINGVDVDPTLSDREEPRGILGACPFPASRQHQCIDY
jgi:hypothetical protein